MKVTGETAMKHLMRLVAGLAAIVALTPGSANAAAIIDFSTGIGGAGGTISFAGGNIVGTNILIDSVTITGAPSGNGTYDVDGTLTCGDTVFSAPSTGGCGALNFDRNANTISIVGSIPSLGITGPTTSLLTGNLNCGLTASPGAPGAALVQLNPCGSDSKNAILVATAGLTGQNFNLSGSIFGNLNVGSTNTYTAFSTDIPNMAVPDGGSTVGLLGMAMLGLGYLRRRKA